MTDQADILAAQLAPYRETPGIVAALLISRDGFVIAADADAGFNADAVAAQVAGVIDIGARLAAELQQPEAKYISIDFERRQPRARPVWHRAHARARRRAQRPRLRVPTHQTRRVTARPAQPAGPTKETLMEDAVEQLDNLARSVGECTRCEELVASRLRAVPGGGHPHCTVMVVSLASDPTDEEDGGLAGESLLADLAEFMPALAK